MPVNFRAPADQLRPVAGLKLGIAQAAIKPGERLAGDRPQRGSRVASVFTAIVSVQHGCCCARSICKVATHSRPGREHRRANAGTGGAGLVAARKTCAELAKLLGIKTEQVLPFSTGVIMEPLPVERIVAGLPACVAALRENNWLDAAEAIMTTDTLAKAASKQIVLGGKTVTVTGIAKGAGMIHPNMATMLGYVATDAAVSSVALRGIVQHAADQSFNRITVDGDTSTNDSFILIATGGSGAEVATVASSNSSLRDAVSDVSIQLARPSCAMARNHEVHHHPDRGSNERAECARSASPLAAAAGEDRVLRV
jgi:glutamate N-acetyltransferase/amino-acid N-acetyltransferase